MRLSGSALNNEFFTHAAQSWRERLADGEWLCFPECLGNSCSFCRIFDFLLQLMSGNSVQLCCASSYVVPNFFLLFRIKDVFSFGVMGPSALSGEGVK